MINNSDAGCYDNTPQDNKPKNQKKNQNFKKKNFKKKISKKFYKHHKHLNMNILNKYPNKHIAHGLGIIRSIDIKNCLLFIYTPMNITYLKQCNCILIGNINISSEFLYKSQNIKSNPYLSSGSISKYMNSRNNIMRG